MNKKYIKPLICLSNSLVSNEAFAADELVSMTENTIEWQWGDELTPEDY